MFKVFASQHLIACLLGKNHSPLPLETHVDGKIALVVCFRSVCSSPLKHLAETRHSLFQDSTPFSKWARSHKV
jgi:hypothetical protein